MDFTCGCITGHEEVSECLRRETESFIASREPWYNLSDTLGGGAKVSTSNLNNEGVRRGQPRGAAICHRESGVPLSAIVECGGRLMRAR